MIPVVRNNTQPVEIKLKSSQPELTFDLSGESFNSGTLMKARNLMPIEKIRLKVVLDASFPIEAHLVNDRVKSSIYTAYKTLLELADKKLLSRYRKPNTSSGLSKYAEADVFRPLQITRIFNSSGILERGKQIPVEVSVPNGPKVNFEELQHLPDLNKYERVALRMLLDAKEKDSGVSDFALKKELDRLGLPHQNPWNHLSYLRINYLAILNDSKFYITPRGHALALILAEKV